MSRARREIQHDPEPAVTVELLDSLPMFTILGGLAGRCEIDPKHEPAWSIACEPGIEPDEACEPSLKALGLCLGDAADVDDDYCAEIQAVGYDATHSALTMLNAGYTLMKVPDASGERTSSGARAHYWYLVKRKR